MRPVPPMMTIFMVCLPAAVPATIRPPGPHRRPHLDVVKKGIGSPCLLSTPDALTLSESIIAPHPDEYRDRALSCGGIWLTIATLHQPRADRQTVVLHKFCGALAELYR